MGEPAKQPPTSADAELTLEDIERLEDEADVAAAQEAIDEMVRNGEKPIPWEDVKRRLGL